MATSFVGPLLVERASPAAPVPRPPQPTSARLIVLLSPAYIRGRKPLAKAVAPAALPVVLISSRRVRPEGRICWLMEGLPRWKAGKSSGGQRGQKSKGSKSEDCQSYWHSSTVSTFR